MPPSRDNEAGGLSVRAGSATVAHNTVGQHLRVVSDVADVGPNTGGFAFRARHVCCPTCLPAEHTAYTIHDNVVAGAVYGVGADQVRLTASTASGVIKVVARREIEVTDNEAQGITCAASASDSQVTLKE